MWEQFIENWGLTAIFVLMLLNGIISFPASELILTIAGVLATKPSFTFCEVFIVALAGNLIGIYPLYIIGKRIGYSWLSRLRNRLLSSRLHFLGKLLPHDTRLAALVSRFGIRGTKWVFIFRCLPILRSIISLPAGFSGMSRFSFFIASLGGIFCWTAFWISFGYLAGETWSKDFKLISIILISSLIIFCIYLSYRVRILIANIEKKK